MEKWIPPWFRQRFSNDMRDLYTEKLQRNREFGHVIWPALTKVSWVHDDDPEKEEYFLVIVPRGVLWILFCKTPIM